VVLENQPILKSMKNRLMADLASEGTLLVNFDAIVNPSQPNYIAMIAGSLMGVHTDLDYDVEGRNLVDLMEEKGVTWKSYQEQYPGQCNPDTEINRYRRKHNPFISFNDIRNNATRCAKIVNSAELYNDIEQNTLPQYMFYTPDMDNNGHDTGLDYAAVWTNHFIRDLLNRTGFLNRTLVVVTFDEGVRGHNSIYTLLLGDTVKPGHVDHTHYTHYSLLRTVEDNFNLSSLGRGDATAVPISQQNFRTGRYLAPDRFVRPVSAVASVCVFAAVVGGVALALRWRQKRIFYQRAMLKSSDTQVLPF